MGEINRREVITGIGLCSSALLASCVGEQNTELAQPFSGGACNAATTHKSWADPSAWDNGVVPAIDTDVTITQAVKLSGEMRVNSLTIEPSGSLLFDPDAPHSRLLSRGNVVVEGRLTMCPSNASVQHELRFVGPSDGSGGDLGVDETAYQGSGMTVLPTDVGLWVVNDGVVDIKGTPRAGWNRTGDDPTWLGGDDIRSAPIATGNVTTFATFAKGGSVPTITISGRIFSTETFNLTRNVTIAGLDATHRAHVMFLMCKNRQTFEYVNLQFLGPRKGSTGVNGRYALHFHHCLDGSRGTMARGIVAQNCGNRAFVPHASHGITFEDCIAYSTQGEAYWWDRDTVQSGLVNASHDTTFLHCAAFKGNFGSGAFHLGQGIGNRCLDSVVAGNSGGTPSAGFNWNATNNFLPSVWVFQDCVAHNNTTFGLRTWQIDNDVHLIERFLAFNNGTNINHGSYGNRFHFRDCVSYLGGLAAQAQSQGDGYPVYERLILDGGGTRPTFTIGGHTTSGQHPVRVIDCRLTNWDPSKAPVYVREREEATCEPKHPGIYHFIRTRVGPNGDDLEPQDFLLECVFAGSANEGPSMFCVERRDGTAYQLNGDGTVQTLPNFALSDALG